MGRIISINNFKGGVSKTSTLCGLAYVLAKKKDYKVLVVDFDPQADATELLIRTYDNQKLPNALHDEKYVNIFDGLKEGNVHNSILKLSDNLSIVPSDFDLIGIIPVMFSKNTKTDEMTLKDASNDRGSYVFEHIIRSMERVKFWDEFGISEDNYWDKLINEHLKVRCY